MRSFVLCLMFAVIADVEGRLLISRNGYQARSSYGFSVLELYDLGQYCPKNAGLAVLSNIDGASIADLNNDMTVVENGAFDFNFADAEQYDYNEYENGSTIRGSASWSSVREYWEDYMENFGFGLWFGQKLFIFNEGIFSTDEHTYAENYNYGDSFVRVMDGDLMIRYSVWSGFCRNGGCEGNNGTAFVKMTVKLLDENQEPPKKLKKHSVFFKSGTEVEFLPTKHASYETANYEFNWMDESLEIESISLEDDGTITLILPVELEDVDDIIENNGFNIHPTIFPQDLPEREKRSPPLREYAFNIYARIMFPDCEQRRRILGIQKSGADIGTKGVFFMATMSLAMWLR